MSGIELFKVISFLKLLQLPTILMYVKWTCKKITLISVSFEYSFKGNSIQSMTRWIYVSPSEYYATGIITDYTINTFFSDKNKWDNKGNFV